MARIALFPTVMRNIMLIAACVAATAAAARDLGVHDKVYPLIEEDMRVQLMRDLIKRASPEAVGKVAQAAADSYDKSLPTRNLSTADKTRVRYLDMSIEAQGDIVGPRKQPDGSYKDEVLVPKGTRVNPLEPGRPRPMQALLFFDATDEKQFEFARTISAARWDVWPINVSGETIKHAKAWNRPVFFASDQQLVRFGIQTVPSLIYPASGEYDGLMAVAEFSPSSYTAKAVQKYWPRKTP